ncbi:MAG TPA: TonB-dependent receptor, partial [Burkholderiaceae bacterium]|nr:TonB-dependent receptor [Burkholderiaceae bacterium]
MSRFRLRPVSLAGALVFALGTSVAHAQSSPGASATVAISIAAQPLGQALNDLARQARLELIVQPALVAGKSAPAVSGQLTVRQALERLLAGSGLDAVIDGSNVVIRQASGPGPATAASLAPVTVIEKRSASDLPKTYAGGQLARGARAGALGNLDAMSMPFNITAYTSELILQQQARTVMDVLANDPSVRGNSFFFYDNFLVRGFPLNRMGVATFDGLYGIASIEGIPLEGLERVELLKGPSTFVNGLSPFGAVGGALNLVPKRAGSEPLNRLTLNYQSKSIFGAHLDVGRRFGENQELGVRFNVAYADGKSAIQGESRTYDNATIGIDYTTHRGRITFDAGKSDREILGYGSFFLINTNFAVPPPPPNDRTYGQPWATIRQENMFAVARGEYNVTDALTVGAAFGMYHGEQPGYRTNNPRIISAGGDVSVTPTAQRFHDKWDTLSAEVNARYRYRTGSIGHSLVVSNSDVRRQYSGASAQSTGSYTYNFYGALPEVAQPLLLSPTAVLSPRDRWRGIMVADTMELLDQQLLLTAGVRMQQVESGGTYNQSATTLALGIVYKLSPKYSIYGNYVEALSAGSIAPTTAVNRGQVFAPYVGKQVEAGWKYDAGAYGATAALFQISQPSAFTNPATNVYGVDGEQRNRGAELQGYGEITKGVRILGGISYTRAELTRTVGGLTDGNTAPNVPKLLVNLGGEWDVPSLAGLTLTARAIHTGSLYIDQANTQQLPSWRRFDVGARYATR